MADEDTSNCKLHDDSNDCISVSLQNTAQYEPAQYGSGIDELETNGRNNMQAALPSDNISGSTDIQELLSIDSNHLQTSTFDNINGHLQGASTSRINANTVMCQKCNVGFALSYDQLSCIGEQQE